MRSKLRADDFFGNFLGMSFGDIVEISPTVPQNRHAHYYFKLNISKTAGVSRLVSKEHESLLLEDCTDHTRCCMVLGVWERQTPKFDYGILQWNVVPRSPFVLLRIRPSDAVTLLFNYRFSPILVRG